MLNTTSNDLFLNVEGLSPFTSHVVQVTAWTQIGEGTASRTIVPKTGEGTPRSPPVNIFAEGLSQTSIRVRCLSYFWHNLNNEKKKFVTNFIIF